MSQNSLVLPTTGTVSGLTVVQDVNAALDALASSNSGASAPANASGGANEGQFWLDTSTSPPHLRIYDGANWLNPGTVDIAAHEWKPVIGGGLNTLPSAATVDLGSVPDSYVVISGVAAITSFGSSMAPGTGKAVRFSGSLTLTYNATTLILPGGGNINTQPGDTAFVVSLGAGNNLVLFYSNGAQLTKANNLSDVANVATARSNLAVLGTAANLSDVASLPAARANLGVPYVVKRTVFSTPGTFTYTPDPHLLFAFIRLMAGGGGGAGSNGGINLIGNGAGGGAGSYAEAWKTAAQIGASQTVTVGAKGPGGASGSNPGSTGGNSSVGTLVTANGGQGGGAGGTNGADGGPGGAAGTGDLATPGGTGETSMGAQFGNAVLPSGAGANSPWGGGGRGQRAASSAANGNNATGYGAGGGGGTCASTASNAAGGDGSPGIVIIDEYCSA